MSDEAIFSDSAQIAIPSSLSRLPSCNSRGARDPVTTRDEIRVSRQKSRSTPCFPPPLQMRAHFLLQLKKNPNFPSHHKRKPI